MGRGFWLRMRASHAHAKGAPGEGEGRAERVGDDAHLHALLGTEERHLRYIGLQPGARRVAAWGP
eukprot:scaffold1551_cov48-Phaeocystis_antarctica.AAC.3